MSGAKCMCGEGERDDNAKVISFMHHEWGQVHVWEGEGMMMPK